MLKKGGIEAIIAAIVMVGIVVALLIWTITGSARSGKETLDTGVGALNNIENVGF